MNKIYIFAVLFISSISSSNLYAQVPNGGFENWFDNYIFSELPPYISSNFQSFFMTGEGNMTEVPGVSNSAARLETVTNGSEIVPGALILANIESSDFGGGFPFASEPDSLTGYFRYSIPAGDTAFVLLWFSFNTIPVNIASFPFTGESSDFTYHAFEIPGFVLTPDSITVLIASSSLDDPTMGGWIEIDDLQFTDSNDQLPNNNFDSWTDIETEDPESWTTANYVSALTNSPFSVTKSSDSYSGDYSLRVETVEIGFIGDDPDTIGYVSTGQIGEEGIEGGFPYTEQPDKLTGYYKYTPVGNDTAVVLLTFSKFNSTTGETDSLFEDYVHLPAASSFTHFEISIDLSGIPDSANVTIGSSNYAEDGNYIGVGSVLLIDDIQFEFLEGTSVPLNKDEVSLFPNPAHDYTTLDLKLVEGDVQSILFFDALGREVFNVEKPDSLGNILNINTQNLDNGVFWYLIKTASGEYSGKLQIER